LARASRFPIADYRGWIAIAVIACGAASLKAVRLRQGPGKRVWVRAVLFATFLLWAFPAAYQGHQTSKTLATDLAVLIICFGGLFLWAGPGRWMPWVPLAGLLIAVGIDARRVLAPIEMTWVIPDLKTTLSAAYPDLAALADRGLVISPEVLSGRPGPRPA